MQPDAAMDFAPAPVAETAMPPAAPARPVDVDNVVFQMSDAIGFACQDDQGRRVELVFRVSYAVAPEHLAEAQRMARANLPVAVEQAKLVCDGVDFRDEDSLVDCEHKLMGRVGETLFGADGSVAKVTRVAWSRMLFR